MLGRRLRSVRVVISLGRNKQKKQLLKGKQMREAEEVKTEWHEVKADGHFSNS
jgi:hypothetical protein